MMVNKTTNLFEVKLKENLIKIIEINILNGLIVQLALTRFNNEKYD